jgi:uncharacterized membrane protein YphA (DoxX/SURF4 family)
MPAILRWHMVVIFLSSGMQKLKLQSAQAIVQFIANIDLFHGYRYSA